MPGIGRLVLGAIFALAVGASAQTRGGAPPASDSVTEARPGLLAQARVGAAAARRAALAGARGTVVSQRIEKRGGRLLYLIRLQPARGPARNVFVDAGTGAVVPMLHAAAAPSPHRPPPS
jgi:hypothetical protein